MHEQEPDIPLAEETPVEDDAPARRGWDALSVVLMGAVILLGVMYVADARREDVLSAQSQRAKRVDTMAVWGKRCGLSAVGQAGRTLMVRCQGEPSQGVAAKGAGWPVPEGFDAVAFADASRTFVCRAPSDGWPDTCSQHIALDAPSLARARRRQTRREQ